MKTLIAPTLVARLPARLKTLHDWLPTLDLRVVLATFAAAMCGAIWIFALHYLEQERERTLLDARMTGASYAKAVEEHAVRTFQAADQTVRFFKYEVEQVGTALDVPHYLQSGIVLGSIFNTISVVDERGDVTGSSLPFTKVNLADREHIRVHRDSDTDQLFISKPVKGRVSGKWSIQMTRRANKPDQSLLGVVVISIDPYYFTRFYRQIDADTRTLVALVGHDGIVRAERIGNDESVGAAIEDTALFRRISSGATSGTFDLSTGFDARRRLYAYRWVEGYPLIAVTAVDEEEALMPFDRARRNTMQWAIGATLFILVFCGVMALLVRRLEKSRRLALAASQAKSEFVANMSHELRTPLHGILGYAEMLAEETATDAGRQYVDAVSRSGRHLLNLVNDILDIGRIEAGKLDVKLTEFDLATFVDDIETAHRSSARLKQIALLVERGPDLPRRVRCDEMKLKQIMNNLVHNAIKFTEHGTVTIRIERKPNLLRFEVVDTGCGIPEPALDRIFEKFQQADNSLARSHEGTGLGLALVKQLTALVGGTVSVVSRLSEGSRFVLTIPSLALADRSTGEAA